MTMKSSTAWIKGLSLAAAALALGACAATAGSEDNPILRKFQWFSYMEGGDFKDSCGPGAPARYRMIYNAVYTEQVRIYDIAAGSERLDARVILPMDIRNFEIEGVSDLLNPWRGTTASRAMGAEQVAELVGALEADGAFGPPAVGVELPSMGFFWTIAACHEGRYHFTGLAWPSPAWEAARFDDVLFALDPISLPVNPPRDTKNWRDKHAGLRYNIENEFIVKVGERGLAGFEPLF